MPAVRADKRQDSVLVEDERAGDGTFELRVLYPNRPYAVRNALEAIMDGLEGLNLGEDDTANLQLVLAEVLNNVSEHAYADDVTGMVELHIRREREHLACRVVDRGHPMPAHTLPTGCLPDVAEDLDNLPEGGFGWFLIHTLAQNLAYARQGDRNVLTFEIAFDRRMPLSI